MLLDIPEKGQDRWQTLSRQDPLFSSYLKGTFSQTHRALPKRSLNVNTSQERVTFEVVPLHEIQRPGRLQMAMRLMRPQTWILTSGPLVATLFYLNRSGVPVNWLVALSSILGVVFAHNGFNLFNDYFDHLRGHDRVKPHRGSRVIQSGWLAAQDLFRLGGVATSLALLLSIPALVVQPELLGLILGVTLLIGAGFLSSRLGLKFQGFGELLSFVLPGPLLTSGFSLAVSGQIPLAVGFLGFVFGAITVMYFHLASLQDLMVDSQAQIRTMATQMGFDTAKLVPFVIALFSSLCLLLFGWAIGASGVFSLGALAHAALIFPLCLRVAKLASPLSSELQGVRSYGLFLNWLTLIIILQGLVLGS